MKKLLLLIFSALVLKVSGRVFSERYYDLNENVNHDKESDLAWERFNENLNSFGKSDWFENEDYRKESIRIKKTYLLGVLQDLENLMNSLFESDENEHYGDYTNYPEESNEFRRRRDVGSKENNGNSSEEQKNNKKNNDDSDGSSHKKDNGKEKEKNKKNSSEESNESRHRRDLTEENNSSASEENKIIHKEKKQRRNSSEENKSNESNE